MLSAGVNPTESSFEPTGRIVPLAGVQENVPSTDAIAFNWVLERAVPPEIGAGSTHVMTGTIVSGIDFIP